MAGRYGRGPGKFKIIMGLILFTLILIFILFLMFGRMDQSKKGIDKLLSVFSSSSKEIKKVTHGIDVARYQGTIDWEQAAEAGVEFAMIRLGYRTQVDGEIIEDSNARYNMQEASKHGILLGAYFFSTAINPEEAKEEAIFCANLMSQYPITYPVAYNCEGFLDEENRNHVLTKGQRSELADIFLSSIEEFGYEGMFYASKNEMEGDAQWLASKLRKDYKIWVAQYPERPYPETGESTYSGKHAMWQFTTLGNLPGIQQNVDCNLSYFGYTKAKKPHDPEKPAQVSADPDALMGFRPVQEKVTAKEEVNLRNIPSQGADSQVMLSLKNGQIAERIGISENGWSKLTYEGENYYAVSSYLTANLDGKSSPDNIETQFEEVPREEVTAKDEVNLRNIPSVTDEASRVISKLKKGDIAIRVGVSSNGWSKLDYNGKTCYAVTRYLIGAHGEKDSKGSQEIQTQFEPVKDRVSAKDEVNLRDRPTVKKGESKVVAKLTKSMVIDRVGINRDLGWSKVIYEGKELYCITNYLREVKDS